VRALDAFGNIDTSYRGTVHFTGDGAGAILPAPYTFKSSDAGAHTVQVTIKKAGTQRLNVWDVNNRP